MKIAFRTGGRPVYQLSDMFNIHSERGMAAYQLYEQVAIRTDGNDLRQMIKRCKEALNNNPIDLTGLVQQVNDMDERMSLQLPPSELIWQLAAIVFIEPDEDPYEYDHSYAVEKLKRWKANKDIDTFFLYERLSSSMSLQKLSKETFQHLQRVVDLVVEQHRKRLTRKSPKTAANGSSNATT